MKLFIPVLFGGILFFSQLLSADETTNPISTEILQLKPSLESIIYTKIQIQFSNKSESTCSIDFYSVYVKRTVRTIQLNDVILKPGESTLRWLTIYGRIDKKEECKIVVSSSCN